MVTIDEIINDIEHPNNRYDERIKYLQKKDLNTSIIQKGVNDVERVIDEGAKSFVIYGEPQSGKTEVMIALTCKLLDKGFRTIFIVMNDNTELENQNFERFQNSREINPSPLRDSELKDFSENQLKQDVQRVIFCRKNSKNLEKCIQNTRHMKKRIIIDDEADYATPDRNINKQKEATQINKKVGQLGQVDSDGVYIGVTATPGRLDLNNTYLNDSTKWVYLESHENYKGRSFFFPLSNEQRQKSDYILKLLPDEGDTPSHLTDSILRFFIRTALLNQDEEKDLVNYSMLIHTTGKVNDHIEDQKIVNKVFEQLLDYKGIGKKILERLLKIAEGLIQDSELRTKIIKFIITNIGKRQVLIINHKEDSNNVDRVCNPSALFTFGIGGNIVSRGLTFNNLLTFFFSRNVKGKFQQNTYIQRARMFGNRPYSKYFELCIPKGLYQNWGDCFIDHELSIILGKKGELIHIQRSTNRASDAASIDRQNIIIGRGEREVGGLFTMTENIEKIIVKNKDNFENLVTELFDSELIPNSIFSKGILEYMKETSSDIIKDCIVVLKDDDNIQLIESYKDANPDTVTRTRGGIIQALTHKRERYYNKRHYVLPIMNKSGQARFLYKAALGQTILQNTL